MGEDLHASQLMAATRPIPNSTIIIMALMGKREALQPVVPEQVRVLPAPWPASLLFCFLSTDNVLPSNCSQYPFYAIPVDELLGLAHWVPHQKLLAENKLVNLTKTPVADSEVIFISQ